MVYEIAIKKDKTHYCFLIVILFWYNKKERYLAKRKNYDFFINIIFLLLLFYLFICNAIVKIQKL